MKILGVKALSIPEIKVIRFARFMDQRGYFTETYRDTDLNGIGELVSLSKAVFHQANESFSRAGTIRGMHFQWNPYMGKLVRTVSGRMIDLVLDIRKGSLTFGCMIAYDMPSVREYDWGEWIWVPPGFAHGNVFTEDTVIEYMCTGQYNPKCEAGISPLAADIDWRLCDRGLKAVFEETAKYSKLITDKDKGAVGVKGWADDPRARNFDLKLL